MIFADNHQQSYAKGSGQDTQEIEANTIKTAVLLSYAITKKLMELAEKYAEKHGKFKLPSLFAKKEEKTPDISLEKDNISQKLSQLEGTNNKLFDSKLPTNQLYNQKLLDSNSPKKEPNSDLISGTINVNKIAELEKQGKSISADFVNARNIAKTANKAVVKYGKKEGDKLVADGKQYRITLDKSLKNSILTVESKETNQKILSVNNGKIDYDFSPQDVSNFQKIAQEIELNKNQDLER